MDILNFINNISFAHLAGIKLITFVSFQSDHISITLYQMKRAPFKLFTRLTISEIEIVNSVRFENIPTPKYFKEEFQKFIALNKCQDSFLVVGINEFKSTIISLPEDIEDEGLWFDENKTKFLPEGQPADEFIYSYELFNSGQNTKSYLVLICRKNYLDRITNYFSEINTIIGKIIPSDMSLLFSRDVSENIIYLDFKTDEVGFIVTEESGNALIDAHYHNYSTSDSEFDKIKNIVISIKETIRLHYSIDNFEKFTVICRCSADDKNTINDLIKEVFQTNIYDFGDKQRYQHSDELFSVKHIFDNFDSGINFLEKEKSSEVRYNNEKNVLMRFVLAMGVITILILLFNNIVNFTLSDSLDNSTSQMEELKILNSTFTKFNEENIAIKKQFKLLKELKYIPNEFSESLYGISECVSGNSKLNKISLALTNGNHLTIELTGEAKEQSDIAEIISNFEQAGNYKNISLLSSSYENARGQTQAGNLQFRIRLEYYDL